MPQCNLSDADYEALMSPEQREDYRKRKVERSEFMRALNASTAPLGSNADEWHAFLVENAHGPQMMAVQIAEAIEGAEHRMWSEFVERCEMLETQAEAVIENPPNSVKPEAHETWRSFYRGQRICAKSIRRAIEHPKFRRR